MSNLENILILKYGGIHIKPENKGKFTDYCGGKVTQECIQRGKHSSNPITRKRSTFAANARKWKHEKGGILKAQRGTPKHGLHGGDPTYPKYGSRMAAKLAYDTGSRDPEAIGAVIPTRIGLDGSVEGGNIKNTTFTTVTNNNGSSNINFESKSTTSYNDGLYNTSHIGSSNNNGVINSYEHYSFGMPNGDRYHTFNNNGTLSDRYDVDFAKRLGMDKLPKLRMLE